FFICWARQKGRPEANASGRPLSFSGYSPGPSCGLPRRLFLMIHRLEGDTDIRAAALFAFQFDLGAVDGGDVLDDGQAQAGAAGLLAAALVHAVEPLKHPLLILRRDADAVVPHAEIGAALRRAAGED